MEPEEREQFEQTDPSKTNQLIRIILTSFKKSLCGLHSNTSCKYNDRLYFS